MAKKKKKAGKLPALPKVSRVRVIKDGMGIVNAGIGITVGLWSLLKVARR